MTEDKIKKIPKDEWEDCPDCDNIGKLERLITNTRLGLDGEIEIFPDLEVIKCRFCWENDKSVFNQTRIRENPELLEPTND